MADPPAPYQVDYSGRVLDELEKLVDRARAVGRGQEVLRSIKEIDSRLHVDPQFGQPLRDLLTEPGQLWVGCVPPLVVHYVLFEKRRLVMVGVPLVPLPRSGLPG